jgi:hypothetical protein
MAGLTARFEVQEGLFGSWYVSGIPMIKKTERLEVPGRGLVLVPTDVVETGDFHSAQIRLYRSDAAASICILPRLDLWVL